MIRSTAETVKRVYSLGYFEQHPEELNDALLDPASVRKTAISMQKAMYGVKPEDEASYFASMRELSKNMVPPKGHSDEYVKLYNRVKDAGEMEERLRGKTPAQRANAIRRANMEIMDYSGRYMSGKEKVRRGKEGRAQRSFSPTWD